MRGPGRPRAREEDDGASSSSASLSSDDESPKGFPRVTAMYPEEDLSLQERQALAQDQAAHRERPRFMTTHLQRPKGFHGAEDEAMYHYDADAPRARLEADWRAKEEAAGVAHEAPTVAARAAAAAAGRPPAVLQGPRFMEGTHKPRGHFKAEGRRGGGKSRSPRRKQGEGAKRLHRGPKSGPLLRRAAALGASPPRRAALQTPRVRRAPPGAPRRPRG